MSINEDWILQDGMMRIRADFVDQPALVLTPSQAARRFALDVDACTAILAALLNRGLLAKTQDGAYTTLFPRCALPSIDSDCYRRVSPS
jgi:hypothetical protein